jgi:sugar lactone lactonase YvrE
MRIRVLLATVLAVVPLGPPASEAASSGHVQDFVTFDPGAFEFPEGISFDKTGNAYVSMIFLGHIRRISPDGSQSVVATIPAPGFGVAGLEVAPRGDVYVAVAAMDLATGQTDPGVRGVYRVTRAGVVSRLPGTEAMVFPNDVTIDDRGNVYATDTAGGSVWRIPRRGEAQLWSEAPELSGNGSFGFGFPIGANGIATWRREVLVGNTELGSLVSIPIRPDGAAGPARVIKAADALVGVDGIALDVHGTVYAASSVHNLLTRVTRAGAVDVLATAQDGLNQPSTLAFGTAAGDQKNLYLLNFSVFPPEPTPGVLRVRVGVPGAPVP